VLLAGVGTHAKRLDVNHQIADVIRNHEVDGLGTEQA
jgi:hypothetical protein